MFPDLFGGSSPINNKRQKGVRLAETQHKQLLSIHGSCNGEKCKNCVYLIAYSHSKTYLKCSKAKMSNSEATDWRANWQACGLFQKS